MSEAAIIREIINTSISLDTNAVTRSGFGVPLLIGTTDPTPGAKVAAYANIDEVGDVYDVTDVEYKMASAFFGQNPRPQKLLIGYKADDETYVEALTDIRAINDEWFFLVTTATVKADILALAAAVNAIGNGRQYHYRTDEAATLTSGSTTDITTEVTALNVQTTLHVYHSDDEMYSELAGLAKVAINTESGNTGPGSRTYFYQSLAGITADSFTSTERSLLDDKHVNYTSTLAQQTRVFGGKMSNGQWFDIVYGAAWLEARISENVTELLTRTTDRGSKVPYTDEGLQMIESAIAEVMEVAVKIGLILNDYVINVPKRSETSFVERTNRVVEGITFEANLQGAVRTATIRGILTA